MNLYSLSIIVAIYNNYSHIKKCIDSLVSSKNFEEYQIILVNDGSEDNSHIIINEYRIYKNINIINHEKNLGIVQARRTGFKVSLAPFVAFVDGDDFVDELHFYRLLKDALVFEADIVCDGYNEYHELNGNKHYLNDIKTGLYFGQSLDIIKNNLIMSSTQNKFNIFTYVWCKIFKRSVLNNFIDKIPDNIFLGEDACLSYSGIMNSKRIVITSYNGYNYRQHEISSVKSVFKRDVELDKLKTLWEWLKNFSNEFAMFNLDKQIRSYISSLIIVRVDLINYQSDNLNIFNELNGLRDNKLVVVGGGTFGLKLYTWISTWCSRKVDYTSYIYYLSPLVIGDLKCINSNNKYIIAYMSKVDIHNAYNSLLKLGIKKKNIISLNTDYIFSKYQIEALFSK